MKRPLASALAFLIVALSPGAPAYQAFAQTVGRTGSATGSVGDAANSVNSGNGASGLSAPLAIPVQSLGLNGALNPAAAAPSLIAPANAVAAALTPAPVLAAPAIAAAVNPAVPAALTPARVAASVDGKPAKAVVPAALQPASKNGKASAALPAASRQAAELTERVAPVLEGVKNGDASGALNTAFENGSAKAGLGTVAAGNGMGALRSGLKRAAASTPEQKAGEVPAAAAPAAKKAGFFRSLREKFDLSEFDKSEKSYILGQAVFLLAISVYLASLPFLVKALTGDASATGVARMVHFWSFAGASLFAGAIVGKSPMKRILVGAAVGRAMLFGSIGMLAVAGALPWTAFLVLVGANALLVAHNHLVDIDTGGAAKIFKGADKASTDRKIEKAGYVYDFIYYGMMLVIPTLIGKPMDLLAEAYGAKVGAGAGFALFAALMAVVSYIYAKRVVTIGDMVAAPLAGVRDAARRAVDSVKSFARVLWDVPRRNWRTAKIIWQNKAITARSAMATLENFVEDALFAVVLPTFAFDILKVGATGNGLLLSAITAGGLVASVFLMKRVQDLQKKHGTYKVLVGLTAVASLAFLPSIGLWIVPSLALAIPSVFLMKLMLQPLRSRMRALLQTEIKNDPKAAPHADDIYSLMTFVEVMAAGAGGLAFAWLFHNSMPGSAIALAFGAMAPMKIISLVLLGMGFVYMGGLRWVRSQLKKAPPTLTRFQSPEGNEAKMLARLEQSLKMSGLPPYKTETRKNGPGADDRPTVAILAPSSTHKVAIDWEGGRQSPGDVHLVLDSSWLVQENYWDGSTKLLVEKGVVFDPEGRATVVSYETPRRVHYFANFFTIGANNRDDGVPFERNLEVAQSNSLLLEKKTNDKLITRRLMSALGIEVPETLAQLMPKHELRSSKGTTGEGRARLTIDDLPKAEERESRRISSAVDAFINGVKFPEVEVSPGVMAEKAPEFRISATGPFAGVDAAVVTNRSFPVFSKVFGFAADPKATAETEIVIEAVGAVGSPAPLRIKLGRVPWLGGKNTPMRRRLDSFLDGFDRKEVVVKPSGPAFHSGYGVRFFRKELRAEIYGHALALAGNPFMTQDGVVLADSRVESAELYRGGRKMETTLRVLASRTPWDGYAGSDVFARVGPYGSPTTAEALDPRDNATVEPWQDLLTEWRKAGWLDAASERALDAEVRALGAKALEAIDGNEKKLKSEKEGARRARTDLIGLDVMIEKRVSADGKVKLVPVVIEVNDHDSGGQYNLDQMHPERKGFHSELYVATMLQRARRDALEGKRILLVGSGYAGKRPIFVRAKELGVKVVLAGPKDAFVKSLIKDGLVDEFIEADNTKVPEARAAIADKLLRSARKNGKLDGITTFWEDDVELTALLSQDLKLPYHTPVAARTARSKFQTQVKLKAEDVLAARHEILDNLSKSENPAARAAALETFRAAALRVGFPAVLKPESGAAAIGTEKVNSVEEAVSAYQRISALVNPATDPIFALNSNLILMQYLDGHEYDVDLVMVAGEPVFSSITDNKPTREPSFLATGSRLPSTLPAAQQKAAVDQAIASAKALGLTDGVLHMEGKVTSEGPRLIEANARMGGTYVHEWVKAVWGVDLAEEGLMAAAGIGGKPYKPKQPLVHLDGDFFNADKPGTIKAIVIPEDVKTMPGFVRIREAKHVGDKITLEENGGFARVLMIEAGGKDAAEAARNLAAIKAKIRVVIE